MLTKNWKSLVALCALALSLTAVQAQAASIGIDFTDDFGGDMLSTDLAGAVQQGNWNTWDAPDTNAIDDSGAATTLDVTWTVGGGVLEWQGNDQAGTSSWSAGGTDRKMFDGLFSNSSTDTPQITVSQIPYSTYDLYVYFGGDYCCGNTRGGAASTGIGGEPVYAQEGPAQASYVQTTTISPTRMPANYALWEDLSDASMTLTFTPLDGGGQIMAFGLQFVDTTPPPSGTPEPSTLIMLSTGLLGLLACGRRRNRRRA